MSKRFLVIILAISIAAILVYKYTDVGILVYLAIAASIGIIDIIISKLWGEYDYINRSKN